MWTARVRGTMIALAMGCALPGVAVAKDPPVISGALPAEESVYRDTVEGLFRQKLIDPESARYEWEQPYQVTCRKGVYHTPERWQGWAVDVLVNSKNAFGGYTGAKRYTVMLTNDGTSDRVEVLDAGIFWMFSSCRKEAW